MSTTEELKTRTMLRRFRMCTDFWLGGGTQTLYSTHSSDQAMSCRILFSTWMSETRIMCIC